MSYIPLQFPPGVYRSGTEYQSKGRYFDANLIRWFEGTMRPMGGWRSRAPSAVTGKARNIITWTANDGDAWIGIGTNTGLYAMSRGGTLTDITPSGFTTGFADATFAGGYGTGLYGVGTYGTPRPDTTTVTAASMWTLDTWGEYLVGVMAYDGKIYEWQLDPMVDAAEIANSPTARAVVVTEERVMMALGADGNPRRVMWSDQEDNTDWTPSSLNQAGDFDLQTSGALLCGKRLRGATLLLTDIDAHVATYAGPPFIYTFQRVGTNCGAASPQAAVVVDGEAYWMGANGFWGFNGYVKPLACEVSDFVFSDINQDQISKVGVFHNSAYGEIWWLYPSASSNEINRYVLWNYREGHWNIGAMVRLSAADRGVLTYPLMMGDDGIVYEHEVGFDYGGATAYATGGPMEIGNGDNVVMCRQLVPDERTAGQVTASFNVRFYPNGPQTSFGPYTMASPTDVRLTGRQIEITYTGVEGEDWRVGVPRLEVVEGGLR